METLRALIRGDLAPAGYPISQALSSRAINYFPESYQVNWLDSGTSSLAVSLLDCKLRRAEVASPQVIIPGYCCPDLVAAAVYAGVEPLVVDIEANDPSFNLQQLSDAINPNVIAVIAINFLGVSERLEEIRSLLKRNSETIYLIEDNAQWFPNPDEMMFESDYVTFSFGRGKPLSLLGGGLLLSQQPLLAKPEMRSAQPYDLKMRLKITAYNALLHPHLYCFINRMPFFHLGETAYHSLESIAQAPDAVSQLFADNYRAYQARSMDLECSYQSLLVSVQKFSALNSSRKKRLLRYPLLLDSTESTSVAFDLLSKEGLGASRMYQTALNQVKGVDGKINCFSKLSSAKQFASRFLTLPLHAYVNDKFKNTICSILKETRTS